MDLATTGLVLLAICAVKCECLECYDCIEGNGGVQDCEETIECPDGMDVCTLEWDGESISVLMPWFIFSSTISLFTGLPTNILNKGCGHSAVRYWYFDANG